jgi:hypothetical protein
MVDAGVRGSVISGASCEYSVPVTTDCSAGEMRYDAWVPDASAYGIRLALTDVKGITEAEVARIVAGQPYESLSDFWYRAAPSRPIAERLVLAGGLDSLYGLDRVLPVSRRGKITHRDLLLQVADLDRWSRGLGRGSPRRNKPTAVVVGEGASVQGDDVVHLDPRAAAARQSQAAAAALSADRLVVQTAIDLGEAPEQAVPSGLPELTPAERVRAELEILGLDASAHIVRFYLPMLRDLAVVAVARFSSQGSKWPPRPRRSGRDGGWSSLPLTTPPARSMPPSSKTFKAPTRQRCSGVGCSWCGACCAVRVHGASRYGQPVRGSCR